MGTTNLGSYYYVRCISAVIYLGPLPESFCTMTINRYANGLLQIALLKAYVFKASPVVPQLFNYLSASIMIHPMQRGAYPQEFIGDRMTRYSAFPRRSI